MKQFTVKQSQQVNQRVHLKSVAPRKQSESFEDLSHHDMKLLQKQYSGKLEEEVHLLLMWCPHCARKVHLFAANVQEQPLIHIAIWWC